MIGLELNILFKEDKAYLSPTKPLTFQQLDLPSWATSFKVPAYWAIRIINVTPAERKIFCEVLGYFTGEIQLEQSQLHYFGQLDQVEVVTFKSIDTFGLMSTMKGNSYAMPQSQQIKHSHYSTSSYSENDYRSPLKEITPYNQPQPFQPITKIIKETVSIPIKKIQFKSGGVEFVKKFKGHSEPISVFIPNENIKEEYDAVKNYFSKVLGTKKISVDVYIEIKNKNPTTVQAKSENIDSITKDLIVNVRFEIVKSAFKNDRSESDKVLLSMDDFYDNVTADKLNPEVFYSNEKELLEDLMTVSQTKHHNHLRFLSSKQAQHITKLRFIHKPFSFIFLIEGENYYHFVWETLNTEEATYIWQFKKGINIEDMIQRMEERINTIRMKGKTDYLQHSESGFKRIIHDYSDAVEGFKKWKHEIERLLK